MRHKLRDQLHYGWVIFALSFTNLVVEGAVKNTVPVVQGYSVFERNSDES